MKINKLIVVLLVGFMFTVSTVTFGIVDIKGAIKRIEKKIKDIDKEEDKIDLEYEKELKECYGEDPGWLKKKACKVREKTEKAHEEAKLKIEKLKLKGVIELLEKLEKAQDAIKNAATSAGKKLAQKAFDKLLKSLKKAISWLGESGVGEIIGEELF